MWRIVLAGLVITGCRSKPAASDRPAPPPTPAAPHVAGKLAISGHVVEATDQSQVANVKVVFRGDAGEVEATSRNDGSYEVAVAPGAYRVFVRDDRVMSVGRPDRVRLDSGPRAVLANQPDEALMPVFRATADAIGVDVEVVRTARLAGRVIDFESKPVSHAIVRASGLDVRPVLGTDIVETNDAGEYELRVPDGRFAVDASHPAFANSTPRTVLVQHAAHTTIELDPGCVISGRVVGKGPVRDGAIERELPAFERFGPVSRIEADGTFRITTLEDAAVTLRAWPWGLPPTAARVFACKRGARFPDVKLEVAAAAADLWGTITDANGAPVPFAAIEVRPLVPGVVGQQERGDAAGAWSVFDLRGGAYEITASAPGRGIVVSDVTVPTQQIALVLGGTGRIAGTTTSLVLGSLAISFMSCGDAFDAQKRPMQIAHEPRVVEVRGGRFVIEDVPACQLAFLARWHGVELETHVDITAGKTATVELAFGTPRDKTVSGTVRDAEQHAVVHVKVTASRDGHVLASTFTDPDGHYTLHALGGSDLVARDGLLVATATVGRADVAAETVDLMLADQ